MTAIVTALRKGISAEDLTGMVDAAATALEAAAGEQDSAKASPTVLLIAPAALKAEASTPVAAPLNAATAQEVCHCPCMLSRSHHSICMFPSISWLLMQAFHQQ